MIQLRTACVLGTLTDLIDEISVVSLKFPQVFEHPCGHPVQKGRLDKDTEQKSPSRRNLR
jgi:hypothetical protein